MISNLKKELKTKSVKSSKKFKRVLLEFSQLHFNFRVAIDHFTKGFKSLKSNSLESLYNYLKKYHSYKSSNTIKVMKNIKEEINKDECKILARFSSLQLID